MKFSILILTILFILKLKWPNQRSLISRLKKQYGPDVLKKFRKLEKFKKKYEKIKLDLVYLKECLQFNIIPKFLYFKLPSKSKIYQNIQLNLLQEDINTQQNDLTNTLKEVNKFNYDLKESMI